MTFCDIDFVYIQRIFTIVYGFVPACWNVWGKYCLFFIE